MKNHGNARVDCQLVSEFVDEAEIPANVVCHHGDVVRPQVVGNYVDFWASDGGIKEFTEPIA